MTIKNKLGKLSAIALLSLSLSAHTLTSVAFAEESMSSMESMEKKDEMDAMTSASKMNKAFFGEFKGEGDHNVMGKVKVTLKDVVLSDFSTDKGPDLHVYLTKDGDVKNGLKLGAVDLEKSVQGFKLDKVDLSMYNTVTIYCDEAHVTFGNAMLGKHSEAKPAEAMKKMGEFMGEGDHNVMGKIMLEGNKLSLTEFKSDEGPDLHVFLTKDGDISTGVEVGAVDLMAMEKEYNLNGLNPDDYNTVTIYCVEAHAVFGNAMLK